VLRVPGYREFHIHISGKYNPQAAERDGFTAKTNLGYVESLLFKSDPYKFKM
jgi:hypothetical protein